MVLADAEWNADQLANGMSAVETAEAQFGIGTMYEQGGPVTRNRQMALDLYRKAAKSGNARAHAAYCRLGQLYLGDTEIPLDEGEARYWFHSRGQRCRPRGRIRHGQDPLRRSRRRRGSSARH